MNLQPWAEGIGVARLTGWGTAFLCLLSVLALGGIPLWSTILLGVTAGLLVGLASLAARPSSRAVHPVAWVLFGLSVVSAVQALPMPLGLLSRLSPTAADIWSRALLPAGEQLAWGTLSLDPGASLVAASRWMTLACVFQLAVLAGRAGEARRCFRLVAFSGMTVALVSLGHQLVGAERVFGIYQPRADFSAHGVGPLLNPNHLAGYMNVGALVGLGQVLQPKSRMPRWLIAAAVIICVGVGLRTASMGGAACLAFGLAVFFGLLGMRWFARREKAGFSPQSAVLLATTLFGAGTALAWLGWDRRVIHEFSTVNTGKARMLGWVSPLLHDFWQTGVGRGAFETAFEAYRPAVGTNVAFTHPENFALQWLAEWGVLGVVALVVLAWLLRPTRGHLRNPANAGATAAAVALLVQNIADFSLELAGPAVAFAAILGALSGDVGRRRRKLNRATRNGAWALAAGSLAFALVAALGGTPTLADAREQVRDAMSDRSPDSSAGQLVTAMMRRFPADYYFPMMGGELAERAGTDPTPWVQRAIERAPNMGRVRLLLATILMRRGATAQAMLELRSAVELEPALRVVVGRRAVRWTRDPAMLERAVPDTPDGADVFEAMSLAAKEMGASELAVTLDDRALERFPDASQVRARAVDRILTSITNETCESRDACIDDLERHGRYLIERAPESSRGDIIMARARLAHGDEAKARDDLRAACRKPKDALECLVFLATIESPEGLDAVVDRVLALSCGTVEACAATEDWASNLYASRGLWAQAYGAAEHAARAKPTRARWERAADRASRAGLTAERTAAERKASRFGAETTAPSPR